MTKTPTAQSADDDVKRSIAIQNEKTKLTATALNTTAVTLFAGGVVFPIVAWSFPLSNAPPGGLISGLTIAIWASVAGGLHWSARGILNGLR